MALITEHFVQSRREDSEQHSTGQFIKSINQYTTGIGTITKVSELHCNKKEMYMYGNQLGGLTLREVGSSDPPPLPPPPPTPLKGVIKMKHLEDGVTCM